jgi:hypothetical protein
MSRRPLLLVLLLALTATTTFAAPAVAPARLRRVTLHIFSRVFPSFHDRVLAEPGKPFAVGATEYTARILRFVPDFNIDLKTHQVTSFTPEPANPAFEIVVSHKGVPQDTTWAFFNMPPHFGARNVLAFVATHIEFTNRPTLESQDSLAILIQQRERAQAQGGSGH